ncbi:MAG TPA: penicillin acylase family protein, partial [Burkholderiaceae bacterium]|nr:penicillin acylase family protein [Burkholderiaceae bacterium]
QELARIGQLSDSLGTGLAQMEGSNAWAVSGARTRSGKPLLAGDPHIGFSTPAVWWEAHLKAPGFELYGHLQVLNPFALIGHNQRFGWSLTMFQNDDIDLIAEKTDADHPGQVLVKGVWLPMESRESRIKVKGRADEVIQLRRSPHGPIVNDVVPGDTGRTPIALWWTFLESENPILEAFHQLNRADTLAAARTAVQGIHSPGLNVVWANAAGDIGWWASARLVKRPAGVNPGFILDGSTAEADKLGFLPFSANPQEENPARGYIVSANHQPASAEPVYGYYNLPDRGWRLEEGLKADAGAWDVARAQALQLVDDTGYGPRILAPLMPTLRQQKEGAELVALLDAWKGSHGLEDRAPVLFHQFEHELIKAALGDKMDEAMLANLTRTRALDHALPRLAADPASPWWDRKATPQRETREQIVAEAWAATLQHLRHTFGDDPAQWTWGRAHSVTHKHPLGEVKWLAPLFNVGPFPAPGAHEVPNNLAQRSGDAPWSVVYGPSTRRVIDFAAAGRSQGINPVGQSGVLGDRHYSDQARDYVAGRSRAQWLDAADVQAQARSTLTFRP